MLHATDRDLHIVKKALAIAITALDAVKDIPDRYPGSDHDDMKALLDLLCPSEVEIELVVRNAGWILNGTDPFPPEQMAQLRAMQAKLDKGDGDSAD